MSRLTGVWIAFLRSFLTENYCILCRRDPFVNGFQGLTSQGTTMLARHICQFPFQICPALNASQEYHVRFLTTYIHRLGGIVPDSVLGGDSDRHSLAGLICRLVAFRSCTFCCLEPWMTCFHWCAGLKMSIFVWKCWGCLMFGAGAASHDFQSSCDPSTSVPFGAQ